MSRNGALPALGQSLEKMGNMGEQKEAVPACLGEAQAGLELSPLSRQGVTMAAQGDCANQCLLSKQGLQQRHGASCVGSHMGPQSVAENF